MPLRPVRMNGTKTEVDVPSLLCIDFGPFQASAAAPGVWTNMPLADTELLSATVERVLVDLRHFSEFRFTVNVVVAGPAGADLRVESSLDQVTWASLDGLSGPEVAIDATGINDSGWTAIAKGLDVDNVFLRVMGKDGDGALDPRFLARLWLR